MKLCLIFFLLIAFHPSAEGQWLICERRVIIVKPEEKEIDIQLEAFDTGVGNSFIRVQCKVASADQCPCRYRDYKGEYRKMLESLCELAEANYSMGEEEVWFSGFHFTYSGKPEDYTIRIWID